jgi:hypothetical protein
MGPERLPISDYIEEALELKMLTIAEAPKVKLSIILRVKKYFKNLYEDFMSLPLKGKIYVIAYFVVVIGSIVLIILT